ncbi:sensor histidine kinase [Paenibacillus doosanensis]|uniref:cache domain-containing sensor histidine kinase n=1 Tax=Paenibacillus doosanensis TaxID=1229154 RepID=UPI00217F273E|nr:sensor histidine kinase [Paenibacillus doosanensis]MCS7463025.1 sensor histidine kinase [Paenibacillus doosanensis]
MDQRFEWKKTIARMSLRSKIVIVFLLLITVPLVVQGTVTYLDFSNSVERTTVDYTVQIVSQINRSLDQTLKEEMQSLSLLPLYNEDVTAILESYSNPGLTGQMPTVDEQSRIFAGIAGSTSYHPEVRGIQLIANNGYIFSSMDPYLVRPFIRIDRESWYDAVQQAAGTWVMIPQHRPDYLKEAPDAEPLISAARLIREPGSRQVIGMMKIDFRLKVFQELAESYTFGQIGNLVVLNDRNELFYEQNHDGLTAPDQTLLLKTELPAQTGVWHSQAGRSSFLTIVNRSSYSGLKIISFIPEASLHQATERVRYVTLTTFAVCLLAAGGLAVLISYRLIRPIMRLKEKMHLVEIGDLRQTVPVRSADEIGQLEQGFNRMSEEIDRLVNEVYAVRLREKEAQLSQLLAQMNPHFIYNTLESINMMAIRSENYDISDMVSSLGGLLRHSIGSYDQLVSVEEELRSIGSYVSIQQVRYGERLKIVLWAEEELYPLYIPRMLLQPLVENAIYHGIDESGRPGTVWISVNRFENDLLLGVRDDGKGLTEEEIARLQRLITEPAGDEASLKGMALRSIHQRLALMFGPGYGLHIDGSPGQGASFTLTLPVIERKESHV